MATHSFDYHVECPHCGTKGTFATWDCIDGNASPALRDRLLHDEKLFFYTCPQCHESVQLECPCLYVDRKGQWMVWHIPDSSIEYTTEDIERFLGTPSFDEYHCRTAVTWGEWREKLVEMESPYDDRCLELVKVGAYKLLSEGDRKILPASACHIGYADEGMPDASRIALIFLRSDAKGQGYTYEITAKLMELTQDIFLPVLDHLPDMDGKGHFQRFGYGWDYIADGIARQKGSEAYLKLLSFWVQELRTELFKK